MSEFLCKNCGAAMGLKKSGWQHYEDVACQMPELDAEDAAVTGYIPSISELKAKFESRRTKAEAV